uniref:C6H2-type domain-containing protein n=1 Tax=Alexandrium monilatum TaxID=311494 RepID=A0A7S4RGZ8_9DINO
MACQGCGRTANARLCCPTCIEFGRTSFFCGQECFTKNWATHSQLHDLLKKKRALVEEEVGSSGASSSSVATAEGGSASSGGGGASQRPRGQDTTAAQDASSGLRGPRGPAPLPGGTSLVSNLVGNKRQAGAAHAHKKDGKDQVVNPGGASVIGGLLGRLAMTVRGPPAAAPRSQPPAAVERGERPPGRVGPAAGAPPKASHGRNMRRFAAQAALWCLAVVAITAGGISYRESLRVELATPAGQLAEAAEAVAAAAEGGAAAASDSGSGSGDVRQLRSELAALRERLERHDKMLRYIMDRYVEKPGVAPTGPGAESPGGADARAFATHEASDAAPETPDALRASPARAGDSPRKRKGGSGVDAVSVGLPVVEGDRPAVPEIPESSAAAPQAGPPTAKADIGAVAPEGSRAARASSEA